MRFPPPLGPLGEGPGEGSRSRPTTPGHTLGVENLHHQVRDRMAREIWRGGRGVESSEAGHRLGKCWVWGSLLAGAMACATDRAASTAPGTAAPTGPIVAIENARVFDGTQLLPPERVLIQGSQIIAAGTDSVAPAGVEVIDGTGKTLLPGFIDSHVHVWDYAQLRQDAIFGVTTALDMMNTPGSTFGIRRAVATSHDLADFRSAGAAATVPGGPGTQYGFPVPTISTVDDAASFVEERVSEGSDYIKIMYDDGKAEGQERPTLTLPMLKAVVEAAHKNGKLVVVHIGSLQGAREVINAGADGLAHTFADLPPDAEFVALVKSHHAFVVPTLERILASTGGSGGSELVASADLAPFLTPKDTTALGQLVARRPGATLRYENAEASVKALAAAGVPILAGTDSPNPGTVPGASFHGELRLLVKAGLTPTQALVAATSGAADAFHLADRGRIRAGLRADLVLVDGDPTEDILVSRKISRVWVAGTPIDRDAYQAKLKAGK